MVDNHAGAVRNDVAGHAALDHHGLHGLAVLATVDDRGTTLPLLDDRQQAAEAVDGVAAHPWSGAVGPHAHERHVESHGALTAGFEDAVGRLAEDGHVAL